jgi:hypothetical protein
MAVRKYWRHILGIDVALYLINEPRDKRVAFMKYICENKTDGDATELTESRIKLINAYREFSQTKIDL